MSGVTHQHTTAAALQAIAQPVSMTAVPFTLAALDPGPSTSQAVFDADAARFDAAFRKAGAIITDEDGREWIDAAKVPADLLRAYRGFIQYGYATGLMP